MADKFSLKAKFKPTGDQPSAILQLTTGLKKGYRDQTLLGVTGSGKTFTIANVVAKINKPTLVISHNKTLAAQLASEFQDFFPNNAVHYFVSYYDYYQPEAYIPASDTHIDKETQINEEIDRLRHAATQALLTRRDVLIVASVSCIYGLGSPEDYSQVRITLEIGKTYARYKLLNQLNFLQYNRNDTVLTRGNFTVKGENMEIFPSAEDEHYYRLRFDGDKLDKIEKVHYLTHDILETPKDLSIFPAKHFLAPEVNIKKALPNIETELIERIQYFKQHNKLIEAQRIEERTKYDLEMIRSVGYCNGIENYSRHLAGRQAGEPPETLLGYFPDDFFLVVDESHMTLPQIRGMYNGDQARKKMLIDYGWRLPSALDNRPLNYDEFRQRTGQTVYMSATPDQYELGLSKQVVEQVVRPTGLLDPEIEVRGTTGQVEDVIKEINARVSHGQRVLVTTITKVLAEDISEMLLEKNIKAQYLHSEVDTLDRIDILRDLRQGKYDVLVGINLLREGLDLPEVSLVIILDADKEGFLRSATAMIQIIGRAARHVEGKVIMYADTVTRSMKQAIDETNRRRDKQRIYNKANHITPQTIIKAIKAASLKGLDVKAEFKDEIKGLSVGEKDFLLHSLEQQMQLAAANLEFETAARLRDQIAVLRGRKK
ncbi:MAG: excinuclease ABC subunit UvrB [Candidatus Komeilibacteria bacterium]